MNISTDDDKLGPGVCVRVPSGNVYTLCVEIGKWKDSEKGTWIQSWP